MTNVRLETMRRKWIPTMKPTIYIFDPKKPKEWPDRFAAYNLIDIHEAYAQGLRDAIKENNMIES